MFVEEYEEFFQRSISSDFSFFIDKQSKRLQGIHVVYNQPNKKIGLSPILNKKLTTPNKLINELISSSKLPITPQVIYNNVLVFIVLKVL